MAAPRGEPRSRRARRRPRAPPRPSGLPRRPQPSRGAPWRPSRLRAREEARAHAPRPASARRARPEVRRTKPKTDAKSRTRVLAGVEAFGLRGLGRSRAPDGFSISDVSRPGFSPATGLARHRLHNTASRARRWSELAGRRDRSRGGSHRRTHGRRRDAKSVCGIRDLGSASARASIETKTLHFKGSGVLWHHGDAGQRQRVEPQPGTRRPPTMRRGDVRECSRSSARLSPSAPRANVARKPRTTARVREEHPIRRRSTCACDALHREGAFFQPTSSARARTRSDDTLPRLDDVTEQRTGSRVGDALGGERARRAGGWRRG